jgi:ABC-type sulfate/molybdate transport systems ATPase subunit
VLAVDRLEVGPTEHIFVLGPNGAGKTTLLRLLAGMDRPDEGSAELDGVATTRLDLPRRRRIGYVTQRPAVLSTTVLRNVELPLRWRKIPRSRRRAVAYAALERLGVAHLADRPARALSGGEQQRVSLARTLACEPDLLLLDEPAAGLDAEARAVFFADLERALADRAVTTVQVTHRPEEALHRADRVVVLVDGSVRQVGCPEEISRWPADVAVASLVGYDNLVPAEVSGDGGVDVAGCPTGLTTDLPPGPAMIAAFASGLRLEQPGHPGMPSRVRGVTPGAGHRVVVLDGLLPKGCVRLLAHVRLGESQPAVTDLVRVRFDPLLCAVVAVSGGSAAAEDASMSQILPV